MVRTRTPTVQCIPTTSCCHAQRGRTHGLSHAGMYSLEEQHQVLALEVIQGDGLQLAVHHRCALRRRPCGCVSWLPTPRDRAACGVDHVAQARAAYWVWKHPPHLERGSGLADDRGHGARWVWQAVAVGGVAHGNTHVHDGPHILGPKCEAPMVSASICGCRARFCLFPSYLQRNFANI